jgi:hypothetical protein
MRVIIAGSRGYKGSVKGVQKIINDSGFDVSVVLCGGARGADSTGLAWATTNNIPVEYYPANWDKFGRSAGVLRNKIMVESADALIAIWDGKSPGTKNCIAQAKDKKISIYVHYFEGGVA